MYNKIKHILHGPLPLRNRNISLTHNTCLDCIEMEPLIKGREEVETFCGTDDRRLPHKVVLTFTVGSFTIGSVFIQNRAEYLLCDRHYS